MRSGNAGLFQHVWVGASDGRFSGLHSVAPPWSLTDEPPLGVQQGWEFTPNSDLTVTMLGVLEEDGDGLGAGHLVQLWTGDGSQVLASVEVPSGADSLLISSFRFEPIPSVRLTAGQTYALTAYYSGSPCCNPDALLGGASTATFAPEVDFLTSLGLANSSPDTFPSPSIAGQGFFGPNFVYEGGLEEQSPSNLQIYWNEGSRIRRANVEIPPGEDALPRTDVTEKRGRLRFGGVLAPGH